MKFTVWIVTGLLLASIAQAQQKQPVSSLQEDCGVTFDFTVASSGAQAAGTTTAGSTGTTAVINNRQAGCLDWIVTYEPNSATASVSLAFQTALDIAGVPTTWSNYPGTLSTGINPNTAVTTGGARTEATGVQYPFLRMNMTVLTGAGARIQGKLTGWKRRPPITANAVILPGTVCTAGVPCPVDGPTADGVAPGFPPVLIAGFDGTLTQTVLTDTAGRPRVVGAAADGAAVVGDPVRIGGKDGSGNTQDILTDTSGNLQAQLIGNGTVLSGQQAVTAAAVALATNTARAACVKALVSNVINVFVGPAAITTGTGYLLAPGESACLPVTNTNLLFVIASTTGASVSWLGSN